MNLVKNKKYTLKITIRSFCQFKLTSNCWKRHMEFDILIYIQQLALCIATVILDNKLALYIQNNKIIICFDTVIPLLETWCKKSQDK